MPPGSPGCWRPPAAHRRVSRRLDLRSGQVTLQDSDCPEGVELHESCLITHHGPRWRLLLIGAGQLSLAVARITRLLDFEILICDPREAYREAYRVEGVQALPGMPDDAVRAIQPDVHTAILALTHSPKLDDLALIEALETPAFYIGVLGSRRHQQARRQRLREHFAIDDARLARLHGPVGLAIGARTPAEIAVAVAAGLIQARQGGERAPRVLRATDAPG